MRTVHMQPVYGNGDPNHENTKFWEASPSRQSDLRHDKSRSMGAVRTRSRILPRLRSDSKCWLTSFSTCYGRGMKWCCVSFKFLYDGAGHRGFAILVEQDQPLGPRILLQHRAVEKEDEPKLALWKTDFPVSLVSDTGLLFCPWCGKNLRKFYGRQAAELVRAGHSIPFPVSTDRA